MKTKYIIPFLLLGAVACQTKEEPIEVLVPQPAKRIDLATVRDFKAKANERVQTIAMFNKWGQTPAQLMLNDLPDSLDIVVLQEHYSDIDNTRKADLKAVQEQKATKVLIALDLQTPLKKAHKQAKVALSKATAELEAKWEKTAEAKAKGEKFDEKDLKPASQSMVKTVMLNLEREVYDKFTGDVLSSLQMKEKQNIELLNKYGYNGLSIKLPKNFDFLTKEDVAGLLKAYTDVAGKGKKSMLIVENPKTELRELVEQANILVMSKSDMNVIATFDNEAAEWTNSAYAPSFDKLDSKLSEGFEDFKFFDSKGPLAKDLYLAKWSAKNKKAIAIYNADAYYSEVSDVDGYVLPYSSLRNYINFVNVQ